MVPLLFACLSAWVGQPYGLVDLVLVRLATAILSIPLFPLIPLIPSSLVFSLMKLGIPFAMWAHDTAMQNKGGSETSLSQLVQYHILNMNGTTLPREPLLRPFFVQEKCLVIRQLPTIPEKPVARFFRISNPVGEKICPSIYLYLNGPVLKISNALLRVDPRMDQHGHQHLSRLLSAMCDAGWGSQQQLFFFFPGRIRARSYLL